MAPTPKRECWKCPLDGKGSDYCWKHCQGPAEVSDKGISKVRTGSLESPDEFIDQARLEIDKTSSRETTIDDFMDAAEDEAPECENEQFAVEEQHDEERRGVTEKLTDDVERALVEILANLFGSKTMTDTRLCIFRHVFQGEDLQKIGDTLPVPMSKQAVFKHLLVMCRENKIVEKVIHGMMRAGHGGARKTASQLDLFESFNVKV